MSNGQVTGSSGPVSETGKELVRGLPPYFPRDEDSGNLRLLDVVGRAIERMGFEIDEVDRAATLQHADTISQIEKIAQVLGVAPKTNESKEKYRARVLGEYQTLTSEGTLNDILTNAAVILNTDPSSIVYERLEHGYYSLKIPSRPIESLALTDAEFASILKNQSAAGTSVDVQKLGTFTYITPEQYDDAGFTHDPDKAYAGLDANGDPKETGGTYSGILE